MTVPCSWDKSRVECEPVKITTTNKKKKEMQSTFKCNGQSPTQYERQDTCTCMHVHVHKYMRVDR